MFPFRSGNGLKVWWRYFSNVDIYFCKISKKKRMECLIALKLWTKIRKKSDFFR